MIEEFHRKPITSAKACELLNEAQIVFPRQRPRVIPFGALSKPIKEMINRGSLHQLAVVREFANNGKGVFVPIPPSPSEKVVMKSLISRQGDPKGKMWVARSRANAIVGGEATEFVDDIVYLDLHQASN
jgi:hypothetical protein